MPITYEARHTDISHIHSVASALKNNTRKTPVPSEKSIVTVIDKIKDQTGIVTQHLAPLQKLAEHYNCVIGIRPVEKVATGLIEAGHPTKDFHIKGKSANWGPQAGMICVDQAFSKLEKHAQSAPGEIAKQNKNTLACISDGHAVAVPLSVSSSRLNSLLNDGHIAQLRPADKLGIIRLEALGPSGRRYEFEGKPDPRANDTYSISHQGRPIEVLAKSSDGKALTADYDLLLVGPHLNDLGAQDNLPVPDVAHSVLRDRINQYEKKHRDTATPFTLASKLKENYENPAYFYKKEDPDIGNASLRIREMIPAFNKALVGDHEWVVHHNADSGSPATDITANFPATFVLPQELGEFDKVCIVNDTREMTRLTIAAKDAGYHIPFNPLWKKDMPHVMRSSFTHALENLEPRKQRP